VDDVLVPTFGGLSGTQIALVSLAAAVGEEILFRGWLQPLIGWMPAALVFGAAHVAGARMLAFGAWATGMGLVLGGLAIATGGLLASMIAHAGYDLAAFHYVVALARSAPRQRGRDEGA
jgi:membrane protease YdiL (CAAX protease family)